MASANRLRKWKKNKTKQRIDKDNHNQQNEVVVPSNKPLAIVKDDKEKAIRNRNPQVTVLNDFYRYGVVTKQEYESFKAILLDEDASQTKKDAVMRKLRAGL